MGVDVQIPIPQKYPPYCITLLEALFADYTKATVTKHFTVGQSGAFVFLVEPTRQDGQKELPVVVKIGPNHLLEQERHAAQAHIDNRLPGFVPISGELASTIVTTGDGSTATYSAARYQLAGHGVFAIETLRDYALTAPVAALRTVIEEYLFRQLDRIWNTPDPPVQRRLRASYDRVLPVNLLLEFAETSPLPPLPIDALHDPASYPQLQPGDWVQLKNFVITEIDATERSLTLNLPQPQELRTDAYRLRIRNIANLEQRQLDETVVSLTGRVVKTRQLLLQEAIHDALPATVDLTRPLIHLPNTGQRLPNPLLHWPALLQEQMEMRIGTVHGDLNAGNVLVEVGPKTVGPKTTFLIDCAHAHRDHVLYDLVRLESEVLLHMVATHFHNHQPQLPPTTIHDLYNWLDFVTRRDPDVTGFYSVPQLLLQTMPELQTAFIVLTMIRNHARQYLAAKGQWREYYVALTLTLLGSLKFSSLDDATPGREPKAVAFWGAATLLARLEEPAQLRRIGWQRVAVDEAADAQQQTSGSAQPQIYIDYGDVRHDQRRGVFFEGNESVNVEGNVVTGGTVNTTNIHGPVTGPVHTGSGDIHNRETSDSETSTARDDATANSRTEPPPPAQGRIKILFLTANPLDTVRVRTDEEARAIDQALRQAEYRIFEMLIHQAVRIDDLQELLLRHQPDIVHFSGHGASTNELVLQDANGNATPVSIQALRKLFDDLKDKIRCVVLNACYTEEQARSLAEAIDCVIGISNDLSDGASIQFSTAFYRALGYGHSVEKAFSLGRNQVELVGLGKEAGLHLFGTACAQTRFTGEKPTGSEAYYKERRLDAAMPSKCNPGRRTEVRALIAIPNSEGLRKYLPDYTEEGYLINKQDVEASSSHIEFPVDPETGRIHNTTLRLNLVAPDFKIDQDTKSIQIRPDQDSGIVTFYLTPVAKPGLGRVKVELYSQDVLLTTVPLTTQIVLTPLELATQILWQYVYVIIGVREPLLSASTATEHNRTDIYNTQGPIHTGSGHIFYISLPFSGVKTWANEFFRPAEADDHAQANWASMTLYLLGAAMKRVSSENFLSFLLAAFTAAFAIWSITPLLAWPQPDAQERLLAALRFGVAALFLPMLIALLIKPDGEEKFPLHETRTQWRLLVLKLAGAWTGFGALAGTALIAVILWYHLLGGSMPVIGQWLLALLPPFFAYVSARRIPSDRYKMFGGELRLHAADRLFFAVFALFGPGLAAVVYWGHWFLINQGVMLSVLLGSIGLIVWEIHRHNKRRFPDLLVIAILGLLLPLGFLLLFFFDMYPLAPAPTPGMGEAGIFAALAAYILGTTLLLATVAVRQQTILTIPGVLGLSALLVFMLVFLRVNLWFGSAIGIGLLLLWYLWGRSRVKHWHQVHLSVDLLGLVIIGAALLGVLTPVPLWGNAMLFALFAGVLVLWAYQKNDPATPDQMEQGPAQNSSLKRWGILLFIIVAISGLAAAIANSLIGDSLSRTPVQDTANGPTALATDTANVQPAVLPTTAATATPTVTPTPMRLTVARPAPGANRYFIEGPSLVDYQLGRLLAVYGQASAGQEFDVAVVLVVDKNVDNLVVQVIFQNEDNPLDSLAALQLDDQLGDVDLASMAPVNNSYVGFMLTDATIRLVSHAPVQVGDQLEAVQLTHSGDTLRFPAGPIMIHIDSIGTDRKIAGVSAPTSLPSLGTLLVLAPESATSTSTPAPSPTSIATPTAANTPAPQPQSDLPIYESFDGGIKLDWKNARGEWGVNNQRLQVRRFEGGLAAILIAHPQWPRYAVQMNFGTLKHLDNSGNVNVPFSNFHVLIHFQGNTDGYWFTVANGGVACTIYQNDRGTRLTPSTNQWDEMFDLLTRRYTGDHDLEITVRGNQYAFTLNGETICSFQDDTYPEGSLGVLVSEGASGRMWIDNVRIVPLD
jgi:hypothetical protein